MDIPILLAAQKPIGLAAMRLISQLDGFRLVGVVTNQVARGWWNGADIWEEAAELGIPRFPPEMLSSTSNPDWKSSNLDLREGWLISVQHPLRIGIDVLSMFEGRTANLHLAPLPKYRGHYGLSHAVLNGDKEFGWTLHQLEDDFDTGPIWRSELFDISDSSLTAIDIYQKCVCSGLDGLRKFLTGLSNPEAPPRHKQIGLGNSFSSKSLDHLKSVEVELSEDHARILRSMHFPGYPMPNLEVKVGSYRVTYVPKD